MHNDYVPIHTVLTSISYEKTSQTCYEKTEAGLKKTIEFDFDKEVAYKNNYSFDLQNQVFNFLGMKYIVSEKAEELANVEILPHFFLPKVVEKRYQQHEWLTSFSNVIAHAGGAYRGRTHNTFYTNSLEALRQNYELGHRVFELDFYLTSDKQLAAVHDWEQFGRQDGIAMTAADWKNFQTFGSPVTESRFTSMLIGDVLDQMIINKDLYIVTDTKSTEVSEEDMLRQFRHLYEEAVARDISLLDRIIPQIYNEEMYEKIQTIYDFPSVIYTLYATQSPTERILSFISQHEDIAVVTLSTGDPRFDEEFFDAIHSLHKKVYTHTFHTYQELTTYHAMGIDGYYTGLLLPRDVQLLQKQK